MSVKKDIHIVLVFSSFEVLKLISNDVGLYLNFETSHFDKCQLEYCQLPIQKNLVINLFNFPHLHFSNAIVTYSWKKIVHFLCKRHNSIRP